MVASGAFLSSDETFKERFYFLHLIQTQQETAELRLIKY